MVHSSSAGLLALKLDKSTGFVSELFHDLINWGAFVTIGNVIFVKYIAC